MTDYDKNLLDAMARLEQMDAVDGTEFHTRPYKVQLEAIQMALESGMRAEQFSPIFDAYVMLESLSNRLEQTYREAMGYE